ncbi:putative phage protein [Paenibacillus alvei]|uniref:Putative phage protein n=2 Tax=Paenibacillus alvei TaxID=44250 RepID=A0A383RGU3_PAEAL|nr:putative phage protein [Paenibacillus alvei]
MKQMSATTIEELQILITTETSGLKKELADLKRELTNTAKDVKGATDSIKNAFRVMAATIATLGIGTMFKAAAKDAMTFEASLQQINRMMGASAREFRRWANENADAFGMSRLEAVKYGAIYANLLSTFSNGTAETAQRTQDLLKASAVIATSTGRTMEDTMERIRSGLLGNTEAIEDLGVNVNIAMIESTNAFKRFANGKSWNQLDFHTQQTIRYFAIMEQAAQKYGVEIADNTASRQAAFVAQLKNAQLALGQAFLPIYNAVLPALTAFATSLARVMNIFAQFMEALFGVSQKQAKDTAGQTTAVNNLGAAYDGAGKSAEKAGKKAAKASRSVAGFDEVNQLLESKGDTGKTDEDGGSNGGIPELGVPEVDTDTIPNQIKEMAEKVKKILSNVFEPFKKAWDKHGQGVTQEFARAVEGTKAVLKSFGELLISVWDNGGSVFLENIVSLGLEITRLGLRIYNDFILPVVGWFVDFLNPETNAATRGILDGINWLLEKMIEFVSYLAGDGFGYVQIALGGLAGALLGLAVYKTIIGIIEFIKGFAAAVKVLMAAMVANPITLVVVAIGALVGAFVTAYTTNENFRNAVDRLWGQLKNFLIPIFEAVKSVCIEVWNSVLAPLGVFLAGVFVAAWDAVIKVAKFLWNEVLVPFGEFLLWFWNEVISPLAEILNASLAIAFETVSEVAKLLWENVLVPLSEFLAETFYKVIESLIEIVSHWWQEILKPFGEYLKSTFHPIIEALIKVFQFLWKEVFQPIAKFISGVFVKVFENMSISIKDIIGGLKSIFGGLIDFITGVFTGNWQKAWEGVRSIFKGIFDSLWGIVKIPLNLIIDGINWVISGLNKISFGLPDWDVLGEYAGKGFGINISPIPKLARGGIVDSPTLAMIGEAGKEAVVPLENTSFVNNLASALGSAVMAAMQVAGGGQQAQSGGGDIVLQLDGTTIARVLNPYLSQEQGRIGSAIIQPL